MNTKVLFGQVGRNSFGALLSQMILMANGLATVYVLTQTLGRTDYGNYATAIALVYVTAPLLEVGINHMLARSVAQSDNPQRMWSIGATVHGLGALTGAVALMLAQPLILPEVPRLVIGLLVLSELAGPAMVAGAVLAFEGANQSLGGTRVRLLATGFKFSALLVLLALSAQTLVVWSLLQLLASVVTAWMVVRSVDRQLGLSLAFQLPSREEVWTGLGFATNQVATTGQKDADKVIMGAYSLNGEAADYTAGYRFVAIGLTPLIALLNGTYGQFFRAGAESISKVRRLAVRLTLLSLALLSPVCALLFFGAPALPAILGDEFAESADVVRLLAVLPFVKVFQGFANNALVGAGYLGKRVRAVIGTLALNVVLNVLWVPEYGWRGAAWATLIVEVLLAVLMWTALLRLDGTQAEVATV